MDTRVGFIKTTLIDFPETIACAVFFPGCNMRCPYCQNRELVTGTISEQTESGCVSLTEVYSHLEKRKNVIQGLVISGGEALLSAEIVPLIVYAKKLGYKIKLDTNGTLPDALRQIMENPETAPDMIALDIKTQPDRYTELLPIFAEKQNVSIRKKLQETAEYLRSYKNVEYRTVLVPSLVTAEDIPLMAALVPPDAPWFFTAFRPGNCLDRLMNNAEPYSAQETEKIIAIAQRFVLNVSLRT